MKKFIQQWIFSLRQRNLSKYTIKNYSLGIKKFHEFINGKSLIEIDQSDFQKFIENCKKNFSEGTVKNYVATLKVFYQWLYRSGYMVRDVSHWVPKQRRSRKVLKNVPSISQIKKIILAPDINTPSGYRDRTMYLTQYAGGLRAKELLGMKINSVDEGKQTIHVIRKGGDHQEIPVGSLAIHYLMDYITQIRPQLKPQGDCLWVNDRGRQMGDVTYRKFLKKYLQTLGLGHLSTHQFRHAAASHMMAGGCPLYTIKAFLGHKDIQSTEVYTKINGVQLAEIIDRMT